MVNAKRQRMRLRRIRRARRQAGPIGVPQNERGRRLQSVAARARRWLATAPQSTTLQSYNGRAAYQRRLMVRGRIF